MTESRAKHLSEIGLAAQLLLFGALLPFPSAVASASELALADADPPAAAPVEVIFTGFVRRTDKGASIFVRMTGEVPVALEQAGRRLVYRLTGAKLGVKNNANPLPTGSFGPPVASVALVAGDGVVDVVIELTSDPGEQTSTHRIFSQGGMATLVVELPPEKL